MKRVIVICEGETEQTFVKKLLYNHFISKGITIEAPLIKTSRGGIVRWPALKSQIETHFKAENNIYVTTFVDYYGVYSKHEFPDWEQAHLVADKFQRMTMLEAGMKNDIAPDYRHRFIPYLQLHEFEGLLFSEIDVIYSQIPVPDLVGKKELEETFAAYSNPEMINSGKETSPSHRLQRIIRGYNKVVYGDILADAIGLNRIRAKSVRFHNWISQIEQLSVI